MVDNEVLLSKAHQQINYYQINDNALLCEIKPFVSNCKLNDFSIEGGVVKLIQYNNQMCYQHNNADYGHCP